MKKNIISIIVLLTICQSVFSQQMLVQQDTILSTIQNLDEVTVTSTKELHKLKALPAAVSLLSNQRIEDNKIESLKDLSSFIPNLFMPDYGSKLTSPIFIRGIGSKDYSPSVGLYVDGVPYFERACFDFEFSDIESIEVLRGPQGTLYGRNTMGGIINIHTKSPANYTGTTINIGAGQYNNRQIGASTYNRINDKLSFSLSANYNHKGGFYFNKTTNKYADEIDSYNASSKLVYKLSDNFTSSLNINYQGNKQGGYPYAVYNREKRELGDVNYNKYSSYDRDMVSVSLFNEYKNDKIIFTSSTAYNYFKDKQAIDQDFSPVDLYFVEQKQDQNMISQEFTLKSNNNSSYKWITGAFGFYQSINTKADVGYGDPMIASMIQRGRFPVGSKTYTYYKDYEMPTYGAALFHQSTIELGKFSLSAGIRFDYEKSELDYTYVSTLDGNNSKPVIENEGLDFIEILPKVSAQYNFNYNNFAYASITKGYKAGGYNKIFEEREKMSYDPEFSWNYELGVKTNLLNNRLSLNLTAFYINWDNQQIAQTVPSGQGRILVNAGKSESKGIEFESRLTIIDNLEVQASYGFTEAKFIEYTDKKMNRATHKYDVHIYDNNYIPYVPNQTISLGVNYKYEFKSKLIDAIKLNSIYKAFGNHYWDAANKIKQSFYYTVDAKISFIKNNFTFDIWGKNLTESKYLAYYFSSMGTDFAQNGKPSQIGASLKYTF